MKELACVILKHFNCNRPNSAVPVGCMWFPCILKHNGDDFGSFINGKQMTNNAYINSMSSFYSSPIVTSYYMHLLH